jgi:ABC-type Fe3+-hydroxamate transport system substrate-binding protein
MTAGGPSFVNDLIHWAGGQNVFGHLKDAWPKVTSEAVVRTAPTIVFSTENLSQQVNAKPWLKLLNLQPDKIIHIKTPDLVHRPSPRVLEGLEWLIKALGNHT